MPRLRACLCKELVGGVEGHVTILSKRLPTGLDYVILRQPPNEKRKLCHRSRSHLKLILQQEQLLGAELAEAHVAKPSSERRQGESPHLIPGLAEGGCATLHRSGE